MYTSGNKSNYILAALTPLERERFEIRLEPVAMALAQVIHESGAPQAYVYFPLDCVVSLLYVLENGDTAEVAIVGNDGVVGLSVITGGGRSPHRAIVQASGNALRMSAHDLREEFNHSGGVQQILLRYIQALDIQIGQTAVCNRHHNVVQQLCRWLLMSIDRLPDNRLTMTQELIANMLGVRREGVTLAAGKLQQTGAITYQRGRIEVVNRALLEASCCECYEAVKQEYARLLPWNTTAQANRSTVISGSA